MLLRGIRRRLRLLIILGGLAVCGCVHTSPTPPDAPTDALCGLTQHNYDTLADSLVNALGDDLNWERRVDLLATGSTEPVVFCAMSNIVLDLRDAPVERSRTQDWLGKHKAGAHK